MNQSCIKLINSFWQCHHVLQKKAVKASNETPGMVHQEVEKIYKLTDSGRYNCTEDVKTAGVHL